MPTTYILEQLVAENFTTVPTQDPLDVSQWTTSTGFSDLQTSLNGCVATTTTACQAARTDISFPDDQYVDFVIEPVVVTASANGIKAGVRVDAGVTQGYYLVLTQTARFGTLGSISIQDVSGRQIGPSFSGLINYGDSFRLFCSGSNLFAFQNTIPIISTTDSLYTHGGSPTLYILDTSSSPSKKFVSFGAGEVLIGSGTTKDTILGKFEGISHDGGSGANGAFDNPGNLDLMQVRAPGGKIIWRADGQGDDNDDPPNPTGKTIFGCFVGETFAAAFYNPYKQDILQVVNPQGQVVYFIDYQGNGLFTGF